MASSKKQGAASTRGAASEPVDYTAVPQESQAQKPDKEALANSGYTLPAEFYAMEEAGGDPAQTAQILADQSDAPTTLDEQNAKADETQRAYLESQGREYRVLGQSAPAAGQKNASGPSANKAADTSASRSKAKD